MGGFKVMGRSIAGSFFVECLLREAGAPYEYVHISRTHGKSPEFLALNPLARIPVLELPDGSRIIESAAIFIHLVERFPQLAPPAGSPERDRMCAAGRDVDKPLSGAASLPPHLHYAAENNFDDVREMAIVDGDRWWDYVDGQLDPFLSGAAPMAADFYLFMMTRWAPDRDRMLDGRSSLAAFIDSMRLHPTVDAVTRSHDRPSGS